MAKIIIQEGVKPVAPLPQTMVMYSRDSGFYALSPDGQDIRLNKGDFGAEVDFFAGNNTPYFADVDSFGFEDAAGMPTNEDTDVIFKLDATSLYLNRGAILTIIYALSETSSGQVLNLRLDYVVHNRGELFNGGTPYGQSVELTVNAVQDALFASPVFVLPNGHVSANTVEVECRLSRLGSSAIDTYVGDVGLKHVIVGQV